jgi:hypothetical protein
VKKAAIILSTVVGALVLITLSAPAPGIADEDFIKGLDIGDPVIHENLAVYPVYLPGGGEKLGDILTMAEAQETGKFKIKEIEEGAEVNTLEVHNNTDKSVVLLAGEMIRGAKQDRIVSYDTVIPPGGKFNVDAFCVEAGRWEEKSTHFSYAKEIAPAKVRSTAQGKKDQSEVWSEVSMVNAECGTVTDTDALTASYDSKEFKDKVNSYEKAFKNVGKDGDVVGVVVVAEGEVVAGDVFGNHDLFVKMWPRLLTSYAMDAALAGDLGDVPTAADIGTYLAQLREAEREEVYKDEKQNRSALKKGSTEAYEFEYEDNMVHLNMY